MKDNKLIAEFMGWDIESPTTIPSNLHLSNLELDSGEVWAYKFHTSWDWLMPVVEKIEEIGIDVYSDDHLTVKEHRYRFDMGYTQCNIYDHVRDGVIASADMGTKLLSTHRAVVEFIINNKVIIEDTDDEASDMLYGVDNNQ